MAAENEARLRGEVAGLKSSAGSAAAALAGAGARWGGDLELGSRSPVRNRQVAPRGRGLHSFPIQLNFSSSVHRITQLNS